MNRWIGIAMVVVIVAMPVIAQEDDLPAISVKGQLELFYESSKDIGGDGDDDTFKSNELYLQLDGKFDKNLAARLKLDGADIISSDGKTVTEKIVEEANFTLKEIADSPATLVFGKDEMPFGMDYDKYLNDSIAHQFEYDKVWGFHGIVDVANVGTVAAATFQHRHSDDDEVSPTKELGDSFCGKITIDKPVKNLKLVLSGSTESYADTETTDEETGVVTMTDKDDETRLGAGVVYKIAGFGTVNAEYIAFSSLKGTPDYDPSLTTLGVECDATEKIKVWGRVEIIGDDTSDDVENNFYSVGIKYTPVKNYDLLVEYSNFNSGDMKDATDLKVADGSIEDAILIGVKAKF